MTKLPSEHMIMPLLSKSQSLVTKRTNIMRTEHYLFDVLGIAPKSMTNVC